MRTPLRKKSEITGTVLGYVMALIVFSLILLYGYKIIGKFRGDAERIAITQLSVDMKNAVKKIGAEYGTVDKRTLELPTGFTKVCFINLFYATDNPTSLDSEGICDSMNSDHHFGICDAWKDSKDNKGVNMFLLKEKDIGSDPVDVGPVKIEIGTTPDIHYLCLTPINGKVDIRLEGLGDSVKLDKWPTT